MTGRRDARFWLLAAAAACAIVAAFSPRVSIPRQRVDALFVVDITGSMNVRDYRHGEAPESRLAHVSRELAALVAGLPCGSRAGLALFAERRPFLLLAPMETCANYATLAGTLAALDWRMGWEGDSYVASGLYQSIDLASRYGTDLVFLTDGQESPPTHWSGPPRYEGEPGKVRGLVVGVGGTVPSPIPKFDRDGREIGFLAADDVTQENRSGEPPADVQHREGWHPRNAPWGAAAAQGEEHLSSVREPFLRTLAGMTGLGYATLAPGLDLERAIVRDATPREVDAHVPLAPFLAALALACLCIVWLLPAIARAARSIRLRSMIIRRHA
ncbi:vWA domain-containing protein [Dokdonella sp. MW10]|uniref:vWA domain-containing protein n=1 Tax=Dokdonella sp. MW10 TaxID=2992926 RepID=UPI003F81C92A